MQKQGNSKNRNELCAKPWLRLAVAGFGVITAVLIMSGCLSSKNSVIYVNDSERIAMVDANEPTPFAGVLISEGHFEELLDYKGKVLSGDCK